MRRSILVLGLAILSVAAFREIYDFVVTNDGIHYFASRPQRLLNISGIALAGGVLTLLISKLSPTARRRLTLVTLASIAAIATMIVAAFVAAMTTYSSEITDLGSWRLSLLALGSLAAVASVVWFEFVFTLRRDEKPVS